MPVFSNVGESGCGLAPHERAPYAVIFGLAGVEERMFGVYRCDIERAVRKLGVEKIFDIGPRSKAPPKELAGIEVIANGALPRTAVSELLQQARFGLLAYPFDVLGKSGVFAAYAAHGVIPLVFADRRIAFDGLQSHSHFLDGLTPESLTTDVVRLADMQRNLFAWYSSHSLPTQAMVISEMLADVDSHVQGRHPDVM
jgi:hypothetical protein